jgi:5-methylthioadenosine/S-adenosylhomocysteine deaminase
MVLLVRGRDVVTMNAARDVLRDGAVAVVDDRIAAVGTFADLSAAHPGATVVGTAQSLVTPGYVNAHQHLTGDRLVRSCIPDAITSQEAIFEWAVPVHAAHTGDDDELSASLALVEAVGNGITCTVEPGTVAHPERVVAAMHAVGVRGTIGRWGWDIDDAPYAAPAAEVLAVLEDLLDTTAGDPLVSAWVTLVGHDLMSDDLAAGAADLARRRSTNLTFHISPSPGDAVAYLARTGRRPLVHLDSLGVLGPNVLLGHAVHLDDAEVELVLERGTAVASCPWAYLRLAQGITAGGRHGELVRRGGRIAIGCDSENAGDAVDVLRAAALFVGLARDAALDPFSVTAHDALELLTIRGAEAIGMADRIGSLEVGKQADIVVHDTSGPQWHPASTDPVRQLVWASDGRSVSDVLVAGRVVVRDGTCVTVDVAALNAAAAERNRTLLREVGRS